MCSSPRGSTDELTLDVFYEHPDDEPFARRLVEGLEEAVARLAPYIVLNVLLWPAEHVEPWPVNVPDGSFTAVQHAPREAMHESLLLTRMGLVHCGYGTAGRCVVSLAAAEAKESRGGDPIDVVIHEWIHTLVGKVINGRTVPFVDCATDHGYQGVPGDDGEPRWEDWYRRCLGGPGPPDDQMTS